MTTHSFRPYKVSAAYRAHVALQATWGECAGSRVVESFGDPVREAAQAREAAGLQDVSSMGKFDLQGTDIGDLLADAGRWDGVAAVLRLKPGCALVLTEATDESRVQQVLRATLARAPGCAHLTVVTSGLSAYRLVGPRAREVLSRVTALDVRPDRFGVGACAQGELARVHATIHRADWGDFPGYVLLVGRDVGEYVWTAMQAAGSTLGLTPFGRAAERLLRPVESVKQSTVGTVS